MNRRPAAVVFDMDGVLVDTEPTWDEVRRELAERDGVPWPPEATQAMMGLSTREWAAYLVDHVGISGDAESAARRTIDGLRERYRRELAVKPQAVEAIMRMAELAPVAVASSSPKILIDTILEVLGVSSVFAATVSTEEVDAGKPAPDGYLRACHLLGADPASSVAVEDSSNGILSAARAGMIIVAVPDEFTRAERGKLQLAHAVVDSLAALNEELVTDLLSRRFRGHTEGDFLDLPWDGAL